MKTFNQKIVTENSMTESFNSNVGVRQGDELSVILINSTALYCKDQGKYVKQNGTDQYIHG